MRGSHEGGEMSLTQAQYYKIVIDLRDAMKTLMHQNKELVYKNRQLTKKLNLIKRTVKEVEECSQL